MKVVHVFDDADGTAHELSAQCACGPRQQPDGGGLMIVHALEPDTLPEHPLTADRCEALIPKEIG